MITLPGEGSPSRGTLRAHWASLWLVAGAATTAASLSIRRRTTVVPVGLAAAGAGIGLFRPGLARRPYRAWNQCAHRVADVLIDRVTRLAHLTAIPRKPAPEFTPAGEHGADARGWQAARSQPVRAHHPGNPLAALARSVEVPRRRWLACCLATLRWLQDPHAPPTPVSRSGNTYTLY